MRLRDAFHNDRRVDTQAWRDTAYIKNFLRLEGAVECDVCIIGAGFAGISCAYQLATAGIDVAVVEQNQVGWGASGRIDDTNCKLVSHLNGNNEFSDFANEALALTLDMIAKFSLSILTIDKEYILQNPVDFLLAEANAVIAAGAKIYEDARVKTLEKEPEKESASFQLTTDTGKLKAKQVIVCAGAYVGDLLKAARECHKPTVVKHSIDKGVAGYISTNKRALPHIGMAMPGLYFVQGLGRYGIVDAHLCAQALREMLGGDVQKFAALNAIDHRPYLVRRFTKGL
jgi:glycine/D-amino acid oxidase-like deaminating enzyme